MATPPLRPLGPAHRAEGAFVVSVELPPAPDAPARGSLPLRVPQRQVDPHPASPLSKKVPLPLAEIPLLLHVLVQLFDYDLSVMVRVFVLFLERKRTKKNFYRDKKRACFLQMRKQALGLFCFCSFFFWVFAPSQSRLPRPGEIIFQQNTYLKGET